MSTLTFDQLRQANELRLPQFKNKHGEPAHSQPDGSDWSVAEWIQAWIGEVGELCELRAQYEAGQISFAEYKTEMAKELPDSLIYQDILAQRILDQTAKGDHIDRAQTLMHLMMYIGLYANTAKKQQRGDIKDLGAFQDMAGMYLRKAQLVLDSLRMQVDSTFPQARNLTEMVGDGLDLGQCVKDKFNETSEKVGSSVFIGDHGTFRQTEDPQ